MTKSINRVQKIELGTELHIIDLTTVVFISLIGDAVTVSFHGTTNQMMINRPNGVKDVQFRQTFLDLYVKWNKMIEEILYNQHGVVYDG